MNYKFNPKSKKEGEFFFNFFWNLGKTSGISPKNFETKCQEFLFIEDKRILYSPRLSRTCFKYFDHVEILLVKKNKLNLKLYSKLYDVEDNYMIVEKKWNIITMTVN